MENLGEDGEQSPSILYPPLRSICKDGEYSPFLMSPPLLKAYAWMGSAPLLFYPWIFEASTYDKEQCLQKECISPSLCSLIHRESQGLELIENFFLLLKTMFEA
jgi:hypothetical protein